MAENTPDEMARVGLDWARTNSKILLLGVGIAVSGVLGVYLYVRSGQIRETRAAERYDEAERLALGGQTDEVVRTLNDVVRRYAGTNAGTLAALRLARISLEQRRFSEAIQVLEAAKAKSDMDIFGASIYGLLAAAKSDSGLTVSAANDYLKAADASIAEREKSLLRLRAAEDFARAEQKAEAIKLLEDLAAGPASDVRDRALVRLGELKGVPAKAGSEG